jgi:hypothetical protein
MEDFKYIQPSLEELCDIENNHIVTSRNLPPNNEPRCKIQNNKLYLWTVTKWGSSYLESTESIIQWYKNRMFCIWINDGGKLHISKVVMQFQPYDKANIGAIEDVIFVHIETGAKYYVDAMKKDVLNIHRLQISVNPETLCYEWYCNK